MVGKLLAMVGVVLIVYGVFKSNTEASKTSVFYPPIADIKQCKDLCHKTKSMMIQEYAYGTLKFERTFNGVAWACECRF